ncbi:MAG TPA: hypothetical protein PLQ76_02660 [bacterium]|nr:hypothetical protein [bacterium]
MNDIQGILIGGLLPAFLFGIGSIFQKASNKIGIGQGFYLLSFAIGILLGSLIAYVTMKGSASSLHSGAFAFGHGFLFSIGFIFIAIGIVTYNIPISKLVPLVNMSTLVAVILGIVIFKEYSDLNVFKLLAGAILVVIGGVIVSRA